jgi:mono/diheme cytochrome c family protein
MRSAYLLLTAGTLTASVLAVPPKTIAPAPPRAERALVGRHCVGCHSGTKTAGGLDLARLDPTRPETDAKIWEKALVKLHSGLMPPVGATPLSAQNRKALTDALETRLDRAALKRPNPGAPSLHRLNRTEYANSVRDLLDLEADVKPLLPPDDMSHGFDNMSEVLTVSPTLVAGYIRAAGKLSRLAIGDRNAAPTEEIYHVASALSQTGHIEGTPLGTRGGIVIRHHFPADGEYVFRATLYFTTNTFLFGMYQQGEKLEVAVNGKRVALFDVNPQMKVDDDLRTPPIPIKAGPQTVTVAFVQKASGPVEDFVEPFDHSLGDLFLGRTSGLTGLPHLRDVAIRGPFKPTGVSETPSRRKIFVVRPRSAAEEPAAARRILAGLAGQAYRRPATEQDLSRLLGLYAQGRKAGDFEAGIRLAVQYLLASPSFLFRVERTPSPVPRGGIYRLSDLELATRLSYFLWSSAPDERLRTLASAGRLKDPRVLDAEVKRLLADPRARALAQNFAGQWLHLRNLTDIQPDLFAFPNANQNLLQSMRRETELFFSHLVSADRPVTELLTANYTFVDETLARHYRIPDIEGSRFRKVTVTDENRRGILGHASVLTVTSFANRTSPVLRGKWVLETLLGAPPPTPPANIPPLEETEGTSRPRTVRDRLQVHRSNPACASCHTQMDPIGFALENFDAVGQWRNRESGNALDVRGTLVDGTPLTGPLSLRKALLGHSDAFKSNFTQKLLTYALGRGTEYTDMPAVRTIQRDAGARGDRFSAYVLGIVKSVPFQYRRISEPRLAFEPGVTHVPH